jgi:hypothetical protein
VQAFAPVAVADFLEPVQQILYRVEVWDGAAWEDLSELGGSGGANYLKSVAVSLGGAGLTTNPIAGTWNATVDNGNGIFHPKHPTSPYASLLRVGREVRISIGGTYGGVDYYWQRLIGFMDAPRFSHGSRVVEIGGMDYMKLLADTALRDLNPVAVSGSGSGSAEVDDIINGPLHWGRRAEFNAVASPGNLGPELYVGGDACGIGAAEANSANGWRWETDHGASAGLIQIASPAQESTYALRIIRTHYSTEQTYTRDNAAAVVGSTSVQISFWARLPATSPTARMIAYNVSATPMTPVRNVGQIDLGKNGGEWTLYSFVVHIADTGSLRLSLFTGGANSFPMFFLDLDEISVKQYATDFWQRYILPDECNGPWLVTLNDEPVGQGDQGDTPNGEGEGGWHYVEETKSLFFNDTMDVKAGVGNVKIYYYTTQVLDNVLADLLVWSGLYADRAAALADLDYEPTGISIARVWFDAGVALAAVQKICERANYRFWLAFDGRPCFLPPPVATSIAVSFPGFGDFKDIAEFQDDDMIRNRIVVEGCERAMYQVTRDDKAGDNFRGEDSDQTSIETYLEKTHTINNTLFQGNHACENMAEALLLEFKDPKWYAELETFANPIPLEIGDLVAWPVELEPTDFDSGSLGGSASGNLVVNLMGIIRDIKINNSEINYKVEIADDFWSTGDLPSASLSASKSGPISGSGADWPQDLCGVDIDGNDSSLVASGSFPYLVFEVPTGVDSVTFQVWGTGGVSAPEGGGGGGAACAVTTVAVVAGDLFYLYPAPSVGGPAFSEVYDESSLICRGDYGDDATGYLGADGGRAVDCVGDSSFDGGDGAGGSLLFGGGGGASAGPTAAGGNASGRIGGNAPVLGWNGGQGGKWTQYAGQPGAGPGAGMGGAYEGSFLLRQPGRIRVICSGAPVSASTSGGPTIEEYYAGDFSSGEFNWDVPYPDGWTSGQTLSVVFECWGCGGPGSPYSNAYTAGGGGGGGAYSKTTVNAEPGDYYTLRGASQGSGGIVDTYVKDSGGATICKAERGFYGADNPSGGPGGAAANGVGDTKYSGGAGANRVSSAVGGGGGASAGPDGDGAGASGQTGGAAGTDAGRGGLGGGSDESGEDAPYPNNPVDEMWPGGGGGGQGEDTNGAPLPTPGAGNGSGSRIRITYTL